MKAQNLTISVPASECDKNCPYCISMITWQPPNDIVRMSANLFVVQRVADQAGVTNVLITSKREPFMNIRETLNFAFQFKHHWLEIQTNGIYLNAHTENRSEDIVRDLFARNVNVIAFSIDDLDAIDEYASTFELLKEYGIITRVCINLTRKIMKDHGFYGIMDRITKYKDKQDIPFVRQLLFRNINYPSTASKDLKAVQWIDENVDLADYAMIKEQALRANMKERRFIPHTGVIIYSYRKVAICFSDYCIQEKNRTDDIRSLIFHSDGHLYTSWDDPASILF